VKKDPMDEKLLDEQLGKVQGGGTDKRYLLISCLQCDWKYEGREDMAKYAQDMHFKARKHTQYDVKYV